MRETLRPYDVGIDVGAISTKVAVVDKERKLVAHGVRLTTMEPGKLSRSLLDDVLSNAGIRNEEVQYIVATGQGRRSVDIANLARTEITAFSKGAYYLHPESIILVDIGGQGIRAMKRGEMGIIEDFRTNDKCSSGTGSFLDAMATALEVDIKDAGSLAVRSCGGEEVCATCTVFAESEVVSMIAKGKKKEDILAGLDKMVARKVNGLINSMRSKGPVFVGGGVGENIGVIEELKAVANREVFIPEHPQLIGAMGAAFMAPREHEGEEEARRDEVVVKKRSFFDLFRKVGG